MAKFRSKMGVVAITSVIALSVVLYVLIVLPWAKEARKAAEVDVARGAEVVPQLVTLGGHQLVSYAKRAASQKMFIDAIQQTEIAAKRKAVFDAITKYDSWLRKVERKADFLAVVDEQGKVIARDLSIQDMYGELLPYVSVKHALAGRATSDVWLSKNRMLRAGAAPIYVGGEVKGAVIAAYDFTDKEAAIERRQLGAHVVYFVDGAVRASSFPKGGAEIKAIDSSVLKSEASKAVAAGKAGPIFETMLDGAVYVAVAGPLPPPVTIYGGVANGEGAKATTAASQKAGFVVLVNVTQRSGRVTTTRWVLLGFTIAMLIFVMALMFLVAKHFVDAQDKLELGVSEVISGNMDYTFDVQEEFEGLANALNVMLARLLGRPEPGEEDDGGDQSWRPDVITVESEFGDPHSPQAKELGGTERDAYLAALFEEYVNARNSAGLSVEGLSEQTFTQKVTANEAMLKAKHKCDEIRFSVLSGSGRVTLKPFKVR